MLTMPMSKLVHSHSDSLPLSQLYRELFNAENIGFNVQGIISLVVYFCWTGRLRVHCIYFAFIFVLLYCGSDTLVVNYEIFIHN